MGKTIQYLALLGAMISSQAYAVTGDNPFAKVERIFAGAGSDWSVTDGDLHKSSGNESGTWYHLLMNRQSMRLIMSDSADSANRKSYKVLAVQDMKIDGNRMPVFKWCLQNQEEIHSSLQQGLSVKMQVCENLGEQGEFRVQVNDQTMTALEKGKRLSFTIKPFRTAIEVNFDIDNLDDAVGILDIGQAKTPMLASVVPTQAPKKLAPVVVKAQPVAKCDAAVPAGYKQIKAVSYVCGDASDKIRAEKVIAAAVAKEQQRRVQKAKAAEQKRLAALAEKQRQEELLKQKNVEQEAISASHEKHQIVLDELTQKMLGVCNKMWGRGKHRCYCEKYIEHAPDNIQSNPACTS